VPEDITRMSESPLNPEQSAEEQKRQTDVEFVKHIKEKKEESKRGMDSLFRLARENIGFVEGIQWTGTNRQGVPVNMQGSAPPGTTRVIDNRTFDMARRLHARLDQPTYKPSATALTEIPQDHDAARAADDILRHLYYETKFNRRKRSMIWWEIAAGWFYIEAYFDPMAGPRIPVVKDNPLTGGFDVSEEPAGAVDFVVRSPFAVYRDTRFNEWERMQYVNIEEVAAREDVLARFSESYAKSHEGKELKDDLRDEYIDPTSYIPEVAGSTADISGIITKSPGGVKGGVKLERYYERPSQDYPKGRQGILAGSKLLYRGDLGAPDLDLPPVPFGYVQRPWAHEGKSPVGEVRGLQKVYNLTLSRWIEHVRRWAAGWLLIPTTAGIPVKGWASTVASIIRYNPGGGKPEFVQPPFGNLRAYLDLMGRIETSMEERMSLPPAMRGQMPRGAKAAKMVELLQEAADAIQAPVLADLADGFSEFWTKCLGLVIEHYSEDAILRIVGEHRRAAVTHMKSDKFKQDWRAKILVRAEAGQPLPASKIARNQLLLDLARRDLMFGPPGTVEHVRKLRDAMGLEPSMFPTDGDKDADIAHNENLRLRQGEPVQLSPIDDDQVHIVEHTDDAKAMRAADPSVDLSHHIQHIDAHRQALQIKLASRMPQPGPGAGAPGPKPSQPPAPPGIVGGGHTPTQTPLGPAGSEPQPVTRG
jgi:hypothetical protein